MNAVFHRFRNGGKQLLSVFDALVAAEWRQLRDTNFFCLRFFVSLEIVLFYGVGVVYAAVVALPESRWVYAAVCGSAGVIAGWILRGAWRIGKRTE